MEHWPNGTMDYVTEFEDANRAVLDGIPTSAQTGSAIFSTGCFRHCVTDSAAFWNVYVQLPPKSGLLGEEQAQEPISLSSALETWCVQGVNAQVELAFSALEFGYPTCIASAFATGSADS